MNELEGILARIRLAAAASGREASIPNVRERVSEIIRAANPYGCNQYGEGWKMPHNGTSTRYVDDKDGKRRKEVTRADGGGNGGTRPRASVKKTPAQEADEITRNVQAIYKRYQDNIPEAPAKGPWPGDFKTREEFIEASNKHSREVRDWENRMNKWNEDMNEEIMRAMEVPPGMQKKFTISASGVVQRWGKKKTEEMQAQLDKLSRLVNPDKIKDPIQVESSGGDKRCFHYNGKVYINRGRTNTTSVPHEVVHELEERFPEMNEASVDYLLKRAAKDGFQDARLRDLTGNTAYKTWEIAFIDEFNQRGSSYYCGKYYLTPGSVYKTGQFAAMSEAQRKSVIRTTDLLTKGAERVINTPGEFAVNDPDYFKFVIETLRK